jgi:hypothetical protein
MTYRLTTNFIPNLPLLLDIRKILVKLVRYNLK